MDSTRIRKKLQDSTVIKKTSDYYRKYKRWTPLVSFTAGFTWDSLTLKRIDRLSDNVILFLYILLLGTLIVLTSYVDHERIKSTLITKYRAWFPEGMQFFFGGLFSAYVVFYFQSATLSKNWLFLLFLLVLLIGNEFIKDHLENAKLNLALYFLALFSFFTFALPVVSGWMNVWIFQLAGLFSLGTMAALIYLLAHSTETPNWSLYRPVITIVASIYLVLNLFYFLNWIPPVPLSLKAGGIYHHVHKTDNYYLARFEQGRWYQPFKSSDNSYHYAPGDTVYCFASVFAPARLNKQIVHRWQFYDRKKGTWQTTDHQRYRISGGRDGGYRGYTYKRHLQPGEWRVDVETADGSLLGRIPFEIIRLDSLELIPTLKQTIF